MAIPASTLLNPQTLSKLATLPSADFRIAASGFLEAKHPASIRSRVLVDRLSTFFKDFEYSAALCSQLVALATIKRVEAAEVSDVYSNIVSSMHLNKIEEHVQVWFHENEDIFIQMISSRDVRLVAKALHLSTDYPKLLISASTITDIRPVFESDRASVVGGMVSQVLRMRFISSESGDPEQEFSISLDLDDINKLIAELEKAKRKSETAKAFLVNSLKENVFVVGEDTYGFS